MFIMKMVTLIFTFKSKNRKGQKLIASFIHHDMTSASDSQPVSLLFPSTRPLSIGDQHEKQFHLQQGERSACMTY
jgi:hypothetical protein